jgi:hypothetical protein
MALRPHSRSHNSSALAIIAVTTAAALLAASCSDFKSNAPSDPVTDASADGAPTTGDHDGATDKDASSSAEGSAGTETGPGVHGALPSGYCCNADEECRFRNCATINGTKMCADVCSDPGASGCDGDLPGFTCVGASSSTDGRCEPTSTTAACVPASKFVHGTKKLGACCTALHTGKNGNECEGGHCSAFGDINNPYICINACESAADCPGNYKCTNTGSGYSICLMLSDPYTCDK